MDQLARMLADKLRAPPFANIIVENRSGAGGRIAAEAFKGMPADGSALLFTPASPMVIYPHIYRKLGYRPLEDMVPMTSLHVTKLGLIVGPGAPVKTLTEYLAWLKRAPQNAVYGSPGACTMSHFLGSMFARATGVALTHVPYRGGAPMSQDLLGGQVPAAFQPIGFDSVERHRGGKLTVLAVAEPKRSQQLPDVPTFAELGFEGLVVNEWFGLFAPAGTSAATVQAISQRARTAMQQPDIVTWLERGQADALTSTPEELGARLRSDLQRWGQIVEDSGFQAEE